ncbi:50S ribosomal protein L18 [Candidatus Kinetoplastibacterium sorsogonicusi]|uniref:Large ribosomal subunit protein uL18 n=1 Tax=Candidatus Kinetoplastidibacterium kentomonadis TaxID=1576550 RepID=A0A3Q8EXB9_9PROT|nr:50S ribosomal protein L18 [Candidatus Kinetoplastibacterium sorsogonicusi]AWD32781.1 50S ribosomal protein L18 [Candidatus Kinetoplastibacterium sorsogonicusi]
MNKKDSRLRRSVQTRRKIAELNNVNRLSIFRSNLHIYANIITPKGDRILVSASTLESKVKDQLIDKTGRGGNKYAATIVGKLIAEKAIALGLSSVIFDRSGFRYHGRIEALANAAREAGLKF